MDVSIKIMWVLVSLGSIMFYMVLNRLIFRTITDQPGTCLQSRVSYGGFW
jgi:hypothetical protein